MKDRIFRLARTMLYNIEEAEDITQDILEKLWRKRSMLPGVENIEAFVYMSARNSCLDRLRRRKVASEASENIRKDIQETSENGDHLEMSDLKSLIERMISELPGPQQIVMHLRDIEGYDFEEIVKITGMQEPTARVMLSRARKTIKEKLIKITGYGS